MVAETSPILQNQEQVRRILQSRAFRTSEVHRNLLQYLAGKSLAGEADLLKEYTVGLDVFAKPESFDPRQESVVRMHMARLRQKLAEYYRTEGATDAIVVDVPKGAFQVTFEQRAAAAALASRNNEEALRAQAQARADAEAAALEAARKRQSEEEAARLAAEQRFQAETHAAQLAAEREAADAQARISAEERAKEEAAAEEAARQAKEAKDRAYTEEQGRLRAAKALAEATQKRGAAELALQGKAVDFYEIAQRRSRNRRMAATEIGRAHV